MKFFGGGRPFRSRDGRLEPDHDIDGHPLQPQTPKRFARQALDPVALHTVSGQTLCHDQTEMPHRFRGLQPVDRKIPAATSPALLEHLLEATGSAEPVDSPESLRFLENGGKTQTARRTRPLARRALITARPALVFMRARKPWVRLRLVTEG